MTKSPAWLQDLRKAVVLNAGRYTCYYCGRSAWQVLESEGRTLRFEMDHLTAQARLDGCDDFDLANIVAACRSCNVLKGQMDVKVFRKELHSLAEAVLKLRCESRPAGPVLVPSPAPGTNAHSLRVRSNEVLHGEQGSIVGHSFTSIADVRLLVERPCSASRGA